MNSEKSLQVVFRRHRNNSNTDNIEDNETKQSDRTEISNDYLPSIPDGIIHHSLISDDAKNSSTKTPYISLRTTSPNHERDKKRHRLSYVCQACRRSKTKCDKLKPQCSRCYKLNLTCIYDTINQKPPKNLSVEKRIKSLENDLDYWQKRTKILLNEQKLQLENKRHLAVRNTNTEPRKDSINNNSIPNSQIDSNENKRGLLKIANLIINAPNNENLNQSQPNTEPTAIKPSAVTSIKTCLGTIYSNDNFYKLSINLCRHNPRLIMSKVMKREVNPLSGNYLMINDSFFAAILLSLFVKSTKNKYSNSNVLITVLSSEISIAQAHSNILDSIIKLKKIILNQNIHSKQVKINRINLFFDRLLNNNNERKTMEMNKILKSLIPWTHDSNDNYHESNIFENFVNKDDNYSTILMEFINDLEIFLPPLYVVLQYKQHFMENIYVLLPYFDIETFNDFIMDTLTIDPNDIQRCKINLRKYDIRQKLENIIILLLIVKVSYMSLILIDDGESLNNIDSHVSADILHKYPIGNEVMVFALRLLVAENWAACPNENIITILMYIWSYYVFSPDEGEIFMDAGTHAISNTIIMLASAIGLHRDPLDYLQITETKDKRLINQRRLLWLSVISMTGFESALNGFRVPTNNLLESFINVNDIESYDHYIHRILNDIPKSSRTREFSKHLHDMVLRRTILSLLHQKINRLTMSYSKSVTLWEIEESLAALDKYEQETDRNTEPENVPGKSSTNSQEDKMSQLSIILARPTLLFVMKILNRILQVRTSYALMIFFEDKCVNDKSFLKHFNRYLQLTIYYNLGLIRLYEKYYYETEHDENYKKLSKLNKYYISKFLQLGLPTAMFTILVIITRLELSHSVLMKGEGSDVHIDDDDNAIAKSAILMNICNLLKPILKRMNRTATMNIKFLYFSTFKILSMYYLLIAKLQHGEINCQIYDKLKLDELDPRMAKFLRMSFNITFTSSAESTSETIQDERPSRLNTLNILELLKAKSHFLVTPIDELQGLYADISKYIGEEDAKTDGTSINNHTSNGNIIPTASVPSNLMEAPPVIDPIPMVASPSTGYDPAYDSLPEGISHAGDTVNLLEGNLNFTDVFGNLDLFNYDFLLPQ